MSCPSFNSLPSLVGRDGDEDNDSNLDDDDDDDDPHHGDQMKAKIYSATGATDHLKLPSLQGPLPI